MSTATTRNKLLDSLEKRYGPSVAATIYAQMRGRAQGPFAFGNELYAEHEEFALAAGVMPLGKRKPPTSLPGASPFKR